MKYPVHNQSGEKISEVELNPKIFEIEIKEPVVHQVVVAQMANARQVLAHTQQRSDVQGGGRKPWRQKGTGRARHGSIRSPLWKGGGVTFGPLSDKNFSKKINKKTKRKALFMTLADKAQSGDIILLDALKLETAKTKKFVETWRALLEKVKGVKVDKKVKGVKALLVLAGTDRDLIRASNNLPEIKVIRADSLNVMDVLRSEFLVMPTASLKELEQTYL
jgi:large subunit ribosomal protein L4